MPRVIDEEAEGPASCFHAVEATYGRPVGHWQEIVRAARAAGTHTRHVELVALLTTEHGLGPGHADAVVAHTLAEDS